MMKKHDEGYTLVLVVVIIFVLFTLSLAITSFSLNNMKNQLAMADRMEAKYAAMGEIEKIVGKITQDDEYAYSPGTETSVEVKSPKVISEWLSAVHDIQVDAEDIEVKLDNGVYQFSCMIEVNKNNEHIMITPVINLAGVITKEDEVREGKEVYSISDLKVTYKEYVISTVTPTDNNQESSATTTSEEGDGSE